MERASETLSRPRRISLTLETAIPVVVLVLDQLTKAWVRSTMTLNETIPVVGDVVRLTYIHNEGAAFGLSVGPHSSQVFLVLAAVASVLVLYLLLSAPREERMQRVALALILGGALGNIIDRVRWSMVVDFIQVGVAGHFWPIFNVADSAVTIGAVLLAWTYLFKD
ncbi:MAG TPA: signal peptidase II [Gemmatimonadota bacterium]|nr:signal peptidase II [Gemmatimonadota bacterium]